MHEEREQWLYEKDVNDCKSMRLCFYIHFFEKEEELSTWSHTNYFMYATSECTRKMYCLHLYGKKYLIKRLKTTAHFLNLGDDG